LSPRPSIGSLVGSGGNLKEKITLAIRQVEAKRKELEQLRSRLEERRRSMFGEAVRAIEKDDEMRARVLSGEHVELQKITRVVNAAELALIHIIVRMETIRDVGDVMYVLDNAFKAVKKIGKSISEIAPDLEQSAGEINQSLSNILAELGVFTPTVSIGLSDSPSAIYDKAQKLIDERATEISELPKTIQNIETSAGDVSVFEQTKKIAMLATEDEGDGLEDVEFKPILLSSAHDLAVDPEHLVRKYVSESEERKLNVDDASAHLNLPVDLVEQAYIKVLSENRFNARSRARSARQRQPEEAKGAAELSHEGT